MTKSNLAVNKLIISNKKYSERLVQSINNNYCLPPEIIEDCIQSGYLGLIEASRKYNSGVKIPFKNFAAIYIRGRVFDFLRSYFPFKQSQYMQLKKINSDNKKIYGEETEIYNLKRLFDNCQKEACKQFYENTSLQTHEYNSAHSLASNSEKREILSKAWSTLSLRQKQLLYLYYFQDKTFKEIGIELGLSKAWVNRLFARTINKTKKVLSK